MGRAKSRYWEVRALAARCVPRGTVLVDAARDEAMVREKGRKSTYRQFHLARREWVSAERLLNEQEVNSFVEVSCRAAACPMPMNIDVWDGLTCPFNCRYCFANAFRASLYTAFFDNAKTLGIRHCNPDYYKRELDKLFTARGADAMSLSGSDPVRRAVALGVPMRLGIRFEDFLPRERSAGVSWALLDYLRAAEYPVMINTKSALVGEDKYVRVLADNPARAAVHITMISSNETLLRRLEPGAPSFAKRCEAARALVAAGVRVVARIEPHLPLVNDQPDEVREYIERIRAAGIRNVTFDTYSYSAYNAGIRAAFLNAGLDFDRLFNMSSDSQALGSILLREFMELFRDAGLSVSTFDLGNAAANSQTICCEVEDWFTDAGWNWGSIVSAARYVIRAAPRPVRWCEFAAWVREQGGFLSDALEQEVHQLWNGDGNTAYILSWSAGLVAMGSDGEDVVWAYRPELERDFRDQTLDAALKGYNVR